MLITARSSAADARFRRSRRGRGRPARPPPPPPGARYPPRRPISDRILEAEAHRRAMARREARLDHPSRSRRKTRQSRLVLTSKHNPTPPLGIVPPTPHRGTNPPESARIRRYLGGADGWRRPANVPQNCLQTRAFLLWSAQRDRQRP